MLGKNEVRIIEYFQKNLFAKPTMRELSLLLKKPYALIHQAVKNLTQNKILFQESVGKSKPCFLSLSHESLHYLAFIEEHNAQIKEIPAIKEFLKRQEFIDDIVLITGSYASGKQNKESDLDLVILTNESAFQKQKLLENVTSLLLPKVHGITLTYKDFIKMLTETQANFGKEIVMNHLIYRNASRYYELLKEAITHGFRG